ncbi:MAG: bacterioferritin [Gammaproteobacteria bacterium]|nr:bacterioferritin [Gammaproteobacteria bacterium]
MKSESGVINELNQLLKDQLTTINQFFLHARMLKNWGLEELNDHAYGCSIKAMKHADDLIARVLLLEGLPNLQDLGKLLVAENAPEAISNDLTLQTGNRARLQSAIAHCEGVRDYVSRDLLEGILKHTEEHIDWLESQQWLMDNTGLENYLQSQMDD